MLKKASKKISEKNYGVIEISNKVSKKNFPANDSIFLTFIINAGNVKDKDNIYGISYGISIKNEKDNLKPRIGKTIALKRLENSPYVFFIEKKEIDSYIKMGLNISNVLTLFLLMDFRKRLEKNDNIFFKNKKSKDYKKLYSFVINYYNSLYTDIINKINQKTKNSEGTNHEK